MPGPGQSDLQVLSSKTADIARLQYQQELALRNQGELLTNREQAVKDVAQSQVQAQEGPEKPAVDRDGSRRHPRDSGRQAKPEPTEDPSPARVLGLGNRLDFSV